MPNISLCPDVSPAYSVSTAQFYPVENFSRKTYSKRTVTQNLDMAIQMILHLLHKITNLLIHLRTFLTLHLKRQK